VNFFDWLGRVIMLALAGMITLSIIGAIAAIPDGIVPQQLGLERQTLPVPQDRQGDQPTPDLAETEADEERVEPAKAGERHHCGASPAQAGRSRALVGGDELRSARAGGFGRLCLPAALARDQATAPDRRRAGSTQRRASRQLRAIQLSLVGRPTTTRLSQARGPRRATSRAMSP
jgi:hypothetical protein